MSRFVAAVEVAWLDPELCIRAVAVSSADLAIDDDGAAVNALSSSRE